MQSNHNQPEWAQDILEDVKAINELDKMYMKLSKLMKKIESVAKENNAEETRLLAEELQGLTKQMLSRSDLNPQLRSSLKTCDQYTSLYISLGLSGQDFYTDELKSGFAKINRTFEEMTSLSNVLGLLGLEVSVTSLGNPLKEALLTELPDAMNTLPEKINNYVLLIESQNNELELQVKIRKAALIQKLSQGQISTEEINKTINQDLILSQLEAELKINHECLRSLQLETYHLERNLPIDVNRYRSANRYLTDVQKFGGFISNIENIIAQREYQIATMDLLQGPKVVSDAEKDLEKIISAFLENKVTKCVYVHGDLIIHIQGQPRLNLTKILAARPEPSHLFIEHPDKRKEISNRYAEFFHQDAILQPDKKLDFLTKKSRGSDLDGVDASYLAAINLYSGPMYTTMNSFKRSEGRNFTFPSALGEDIVNASFEQQIKEVLLGATLSEVGLDQAMQLRADKMKPPGIVGYRGYIPSSMPAILQQARLNNEIIKQQSATSTSANYSNAAVFTYSPDNILSKVRGVVSKVVGNRGINIASVSQSESENEILKVSGTSFITMNIDHEKRTETMVEVNPLATNEEEYAASRSYHTPTDHDETIALKKDEVLKNIDKYIKSKSGEYDQSNKDRKVLLKQVIEEYMKNPDPKSRKAFLLKIVNDPSSVLNQRQLLSKKKGETKAIAFLIDLHALEKGNLKPAKSKTFSAISVAADTFYQGLENLVEKKGLKHKQALNDDQISAKHNKR